MASAAVIRVLPVEDERIVARDLRARLTSLGYEVTGLACSKREAITLADSSRPDLVLMDIRLNGVPDGIEAAREIWTRFDIPVIYLTAHSESKTFEEAKATEPFGYVLKPFEDRELALTIETALQRHRAEKQVRENKRWISSILSSIGDAVIATDLDLRISYMNHAAEAWTGWVATDGLGQDLFDILAMPDDGERALTQDIVSRALIDEAGNAIHNGLRIVSKRDQKPVILEVSVAGIRNHLGSKAGIVLVFREIQDRGCEVRNSPDDERQRNAIHQLGEFTLGSFEIKQLLDQACGMVYEALAADYCDILELLPDGANLWLRAGMGWREGLVGSARISVHSSHAGRALEAKAPMVLSRSLHHEILEKSTLLREHDIQDGVAVPIGSRAEPYGVLGVYTRLPRHFDEGEIGFLQTVANLLGSAIGRKAAEDALDALRSDCEVSAGPNAGGALARESLVGPHAAGSRLPLCALSPLGQLRKTILLVEDDAAIRRRISSMLKQEGYRVREARTPYEAIQSVEQSTACIDLLLTGEVMPDMNGSELGKNLRRLRAGLKIVFLSDYTGYAPVQRSMQKLLAADALKQKIRETLQAEL